jgi:cation transporter-like permease
MATVYNEKNDVDSDLRLELYKSLRSEVVGYVEKVPALWLQKFALVGAVIAFIVANRGELLGSGKLLIAAILAIPVLAVLLDAKIGEYGLHARSISRFIHSNFRDSVVAEWESTLWGDQGDSEIISIVRLRSLMTAVVTAIPTIILIIVAGLAVDEVRASGAPTFTFISIAAAIAYTLGGILTWRVVWPSRRSREKAAHTGV